MNQIISQEISRLLEHRHFNEVLNLYQQGCYRNIGGLNQQPDVKDDKMEGENNQHRKRVHLVSIQDHQLRSMEKSDFKTSHVNLPVVKLGTEKWEKKAQEGRVTLTDPYTECLYFISYCSDQSDPKGLKNNSKMEFCRCYRGKDAIGFTTTK